MGSSKVILVVILSFSAVLCEVDLTGCEVPAKTEQGYVCGKIRNATNGEPYASFRGIPYAKQPLGELRFKELQPAEPFDGPFDAREAGPACTQVDIFYTPRNLVAPTSFGEDCIRLNVHVPQKFLPDPQKDVNNTGLLPVFFWIHGGSFSYGSGDADFHGPEYLMTKDMILVTINYRLHAFGFLSLENEYIPGNNGLRDAITALKWVKKNIKNFGGDPDQVTIGGQSAGGAMAHLLSISPAATGLFKQVVGLSGQSIASFYSYSTVYPKLINPIFLTAVGIKTLFKTPKQIHDQLVEAPIEKILHGQKILLDIFGLVSFAPVIETSQSNFTTVIPKSPEDLLDEGAGKEYPMVIGFASHEGGTLQPRLAEVNIETKLRLIPALTLPQNLLFSANGLRVPVLTVKQLAEYFNVTFITLDKFIVAATDSYYKYPGQRLTQKRLKNGAANTYIYQFGYPGEENPFKLTQDYTFKGAGHCEDITYFFRLNTFLGPQTVNNELAHTSDDNKMKDWMTNYIANFVIHGSPSLLEGEWEPANEDLKFQNIETPLVTDFREPTPYMKDKIEYFTALYKYGFGRLIDLSNK